MRRLSVLKPGQCLHETGFEFFIRDKNQANKQTQNRMTRNVVTTVLITRVKSSRPPLRFMSVECLPLHEMWCLMNGRRCVNILLR